MHHCDDVRFIVIHVRLVIIQTSPWRTSKNQNGHNLRAPVHLLLVKSQKTFTYHLCCMLLCFACKHLPHHFGLVPRIVLYEFLDFIIICNMNNNKASSTYTRIVLCMHSNDDDDDDDEMRRFDETFLLLFFYTSHQITQNRREERKREREWKRTNERIKQN